MGSVMNPPRWSKREKIVAVTAGVPVVVGGLVLLHYLLPLRDYLSAGLFGGLIGGLAFSAEIIAVSLSRRPPHGRRLNMLTRLRAPLK